MKLIHKIMGLMLAPVLIAGCVKEDLDDCKNVALCFRYYADGEENVLQNHIHNVDLYVYAENGTLRERIPFHQDDLKDGSLKSQLRLPAGTYTMMAVGNPGKQTLVTPDNRPPGQTFIQHPMWGKTETLTGQDHNYLGHCRVVIPKHHILQQDTVRLFSSHIDVEVEVHGMQPLQDEGKMPYSINIVRTNAQTNLLNRVQTGQWATVNPGLSFDPASGIYHTPRFALFRMDQEGTLMDQLCQHNLQLRHEDGTLLADFPLKDYISRNAKVIDVTLQEAYLPISIKFTPVGVTIEVPAWYIEDINPDWAN